MKNIVLASIAALSLSGCFTTVLLARASNGLPPKKAEFRYTDAGYDQITAFARVKAGSRTLPEHSLVMMGEQNWYVVNADSSATLAEILNAPLSQRFGIANEEGYPFDSKSDRINVILDEKSQFRVGRFCLQYRLPESGNRAAEAATLTRLQFKETLLNKQDTGYSRCFNDVEGTAYQKPQGIVPDYRFEQTVPVKLYSRHVTYSRETPDILLLPAAVATDVVTLPLQLGMLIFGLVNR